MLNSITSCHGNGIYMGHKLIFQNQNKFSYFPTYTVPSSWFWIWLKINQWNLSCQAWWILPAKLDTQNRAGRLMITSPKLRPLAYTNTSIVLSYWFGDQTWPWHGIPQSLIWHQFNLTLEDNTTDYHRLPRPGEIYSTVSTQSIS